MQINAGILTHLEGLLLYNCTRRNEKKNHMKNIKVMKIAENLSAENLMNKRQNFSKVLGVRNGRAHD